MMSGDRGAALIVSLLALTLVSAMAATLVLTSASESILAGDFGRELEARYAAEAGLELALTDLSTLADWNAALGGAMRSSFTDGPPSGGRTLVGGAVLDFARTTNLANCGKPTACSSADLTSNTTGQRPWGPNNPVWRPFAYGPLASLLPASRVQSAFYVLVFLADDPAETDGDPAIDTNGTIAVRAESFGPRGAHKTIVAIVEHANRPPWIRTRAQQMSGVT